MLLIDLMFYLTKYMYQHHYNRVINKLDYLFQLRWNYCIDLVMYCQNSKIYEQLESERERKKKIYEMNMILLISYVFDKSVQSTYQYHLEISFHQLECFSLLWSNYLQVQLLGAVQFPPLVHAGLQTAKTIRFRSINTILYVYLTCFADTACPWTGTIREKTNK